MIKNNGSQKQLSLNRTIEKNRKNNVRDLQQFLDSRFANATTSDLRSQWHMPWPMAYAIGFL